MSENTDKPRKRKTASSPGKATQFKKGRRPHNAPRTVPAGSLAELVDKVAGEMRTVVAKDGPVEMTVAERRLRLEVEAALKGEVRAIKHIVQLMMKYPQMARGDRVEVRLFINGPLARL